VGAFVNFGADYLEPGLILYGGRGAVMVGEAFGPDRMTPRVIAIRDAWRAFDDRATATPNIWGYLWGKEAYGAMLFATALTNDSIADGLARPEYRGLYIALAREMLAVAEARGVTPESFDGFDPAGFLPSAPASAAERSLDDLVGHNRRSAKTHSGIWRDLAVRKRPTEVDAQLGIVVSLGREAGVATPLAAALVKLIHDVERGARPQSLDTLDALAAVMSSQPTS
jgi:2-dehydropantoate 2-reductase